MEKFLPYKTQIFLTLLIIFLILTNIIWYYSGHKPLHWDSSIHLALSVDAYNTCTDYISSSSFTNKMLGISWYYPPLVYYASIPFYFIFGINEFAGFIEITAFLILLVISVYLTGKKLYNESAGMFSAFCISMYPIVIEYSRDYMLDLPLASVVALSFYLLLKTNNYENFFYSVLFGISAGCGMLVKWTFAFFILIPVFYFFVSGLKLKREKIKILSNFFLSIAMCFIICLSWYLKNIIMIFTTRSGELGFMDFNFTQSISYYLKIIPEQISFVIIIFFIIALILFKFRKTSGIDYLLLLWLTGGYVILSLVKTSPRFSIPLLIPFTLLLSGFISGDSSNAVKRKIYVYIFIIIGIIQYVIISFSGLNVNYKIPFFETPVISNLAPVKSENFNLKVLDLIEDDRTRNNKEKSILRIIPDEPNFNNSTLKYYAKIKNYPINILGLSGFPLFTDYVVINKKNLAEDNPGDKRIILTKELLNDTSQLAGEFKEFRKINIQNGNDLVIFKPENNIDTTLSFDSLKGKIFSASETFLKKYLRSKNNIKYEIFFDDTSGASYGKVKLLRLFSDEIELGDFSFDEVGLRVNNFDVSIKNFEYSVPALLKNNRLDILSINGLEINSLEVNSWDLKEYIEKLTLDKVKVNNISFEDHLISIEGFSNQINVNFNLKLKLLQMENSNISFKIEKFEIFNLDLPDFLLNYMLEHYNPLIKGIEYIDDFKLNKLEIKNNKLIIKKDL